MKLCHQAVTQEEAEKIILPLGNMVGVEAPQSTMDTDRNGDTLWAIAEKPCGKGNGTKYTEIVQAGTPPVRNPDLVQPSWVLRIPALS